MDLYGDIEQIYLALKGLLDIYAKGVFFAIFGGYIREIRTKGRRKSKPGDIGKRLVTAAFIGCVIVELLHYYEVDHSLIGPITALSGLLYLEVMEILINQFLLKFKSINKNND